MSGESAQTKSNYRDKAFLNIIKINEESMLHGSLDTITGLPSRQVFDERLSKILAYSKKYDKIFSLMVLNIDEFNVINHIYGSVFGNKLLAEAANRIHSVIRQIDTVSRYAGDNFLFILPELLAPEIAMLVAQRVQDSIIQPFNIEGTKLFITACLGITIFNPNKDDNQSMIKKAEHALARAKQAGRNTYRLDQTASEAEEVKIASLKKYIEAGDIFEKLTMLYQPYIDVNRGSANILQAIPYLQHPEHNMKGYDEISVAMEAAGKSIEFGEWQIIKVLETIKHWIKNEFVPEQVLININIQQLENAEFMQKIIEILDASDQLKSKLVFDVSGNAIKSHHQSFSTILQNLQNKGVKLSTSMMLLGRISLHNIMECPINFLKIDEDIVSSIIVNIENEAIIASIIAASKTTNITVIADGVEFENQKNKLLELGCSIMKGKLFVSPVPANEIFDFEISKKHA